MKLRFSTDSFELTNELERYASRKTTSLSRKIPHELRAYASWEVAFGRHEGKVVSFNTCKISLRLQDELLQAEETTQHMYAAFDVAAVHIRHQLAAYLEQRHPKGLGARLRRTFRADWHSL